MRRRRNARSPDSYEDDLYFDNNRHRRHSGCRDYSPHRVSVRRTSSAVRRPQQGRYFVKRYPESGKKSVTRRVPGGRSAFRRSSEMPTERRRRGIRRSRSRDCEASLDRRWRRASPASRLDRKTTQSRNQWQPPELDIDDLVDKCKCKCTLILVLQRRTRLLTGHAHSQSLGPGYEFPTRCTRVIRSCHEQARCGK